MTITASKSSTIANAVRNTFKLIGIRLPKRYKTPKANAMSVAIGMPQPGADSAPLFNTNYIKAGTTIPPKAAAIGNIALRGFDNSPPTISRFNSNPTTKKNRAIKPSFIQ